MSDSIHDRIVRTQADHNSPWKSLVHDKGEFPVGTSPDDRESIATFIHLSDLHVCDSQSPARLEFLDRFADPDHPFSAMIGYVGTYRAQEFLSTQVVEAMVQSVNKLTKAPLTGAKVDAVIVTGDVVDNAQLNELHWYKTLLDGGPIFPKSGNPHQSQGVHSNDPDTYDIHYYHPDGPPPGMEADRPTSLYGFPTFSGVVAASERSFVAEGLKHRWFAVHGNHDALLQGNAAQSPALEELSTGDRKLNGLSPDADMSELFSGFGEVGPSIYPGIDAFETIQTSADDRRKLVSIEDWVAVHTDCTHDHGLKSDESKIAYWFRDLGANCRLIGLDTVNRYGGWQGCLHREQFIWLKNILLNSRGKYVVLSSHHPLINLINGYAPQNEAVPALHDEIREMLLEFPNVILWISGHVHDHQITEVPRADGSHGFWEIRTASHIDWPQQGRTIEIVKTGSGKIAIGTIVIDHAGPLVFNGAESELNSPVALAGLSRLLAANDWQRQSGPFDVALAEGEAKDRNVWLWAHDPLHFANGAIVDGDRAVKVSENS